MASGNVPMDNGNTNDTLARSYSERNSDRNRDSAGSGSRDYDGLKQQCDKAIHELQLLRRQNSETNRRCEHTMKEMEYYRNQHHAAMSQLEAAAQESSTLRSKYSELVSDKQRLDREISELRSSCCSQQDIISENGANEAFSNHYIATINKYEALKEDYESLRQQYDNIFASHTTAMDKLEITQKEVARLKQQIDEINKERNMAIRECNGLKHQCTQAIHQWDITLRERNELQEALKKVQQQHEEDIKQIEAAMSIRIKSSKDMKRLTEERNAAIQEYNLIMSERDTVHKEIEKLTQDLTQAYKKINLLETNAKEFVEEKKTLSYHIETLKREIASALNDRDKALKECNDFRERFGEFTAKEESQREAFKSRYDYPYTRERDSKRNDLSQIQATSIDLFTKCQMERVDNLDQANQEIERLHQCIDKQQAELQDALQEAEVSKRRRDWAFNERDKIVLERESIRTLCDRLRKERDRAVSDLAEALRDSDDIKRQKNETSKELKVLKEKMEVQLEKETRMLQLHAASHSYSHDSAIDADLQEWDTEMLNIDLNGLATNDNLGVELVGGRDDQYYPNDSGIYVSSISKGCIVDGKLKTNDCILRVNNLDCGNVSKRMVIETIRSSGNSCIIMVRRRKIGARSLFTTQLQVNNYDHGLTLETGIYICKITPGSLAAKEGNLAVGDRVLSINNNPMDGLKYAQEAMAILNQPGDVLTITTLKSTYCSNNCGGGSNRDVYKKYTNSSTQTDMRYGSVRYDERSMYQVSSAGKQPDIEKSSGGGNSSSSSNSNKWETTGRSKEFNRGRRFLKVDRKYNNNSNNTNNNNCNNNNGGSGNNNNNGNNRNSSSPVTFDREKDDALAELDSVIDSYHPVTKHDVVNHRQNRGSSNSNSNSKSNKELENNGGTWPKARINSVIESVTGTILHPRKHKERLPLSILLTTSSSPPAPPPQGSLVSAATNTSVNNYNVMVPPPTTSSVVSETFRSTPATIIDDAAVVKTTSSRSKDSSIVDFSVKSAGNIGKDVLEYYVKKKTTSGNNKYSVSCSVDSAEPNHRPNSSSSVVSSCSSSGAAGVSHLRVHSGLYSLPPSQSHHHHHHYPLTPFVPPSSSSAAHRGGHQILDMRYPSPITVPSSQSGESLSLTDPPRAYCFEPSYSSLARFNHTHSPSIDSSYHKAKSVIASNIRSHPITSAFRSDDMPESYHGFEGGTFPRKKENQRFRIPSNPSVASKSSGGKLSTGSIEKSDRGSPMPTFHVEVLSPGFRQNKRNSLPDYCWPQKPLPGELRRVHIDKSVEPLGIQIQCLDSGGVFVSTVTKHSLASQVGLQVGDQLLEVCGINMRSATYQLAANVLRQCGNSITMLVQYNPDKYNGLSGSEQSSTSGEEDSRSDTRSGSPTPCNSPTMNRKSAPPIFDHMQYIHTVTTLTRPKLSDRQDDVTRATTTHDPRFVVLETHKCSNLGISLVGGNAVGIYVHNVAPNSLAANAGLRTGDRILEYNGTDLRQATAEEAAFELAKPADKVTILIQNCLERYNEIKDKPGDSFYIRAMFDRTGDLGDNSQMQFRKDDILFVDNTMLNGVPGNWRAWLVNEDGYKQQCGVIPSKYKIEEELLLKRSLGDLEGDARRATRRSFFRRKKHQRSDSKELASFSNINLGWFSDSGSLNEETTLLASYQKVTRLNSEPMLRPVLIVGPLAECVIEKLLADFPDKFVRCISEIKHCSQVVMEKGIADNIFIDYRKKGNTFECTSIASVKDSCGQSSHCILDVSLASVERLHYHHVYPIVLLIKFKSTKQIKEVKDSRYLLDKITAKAAKEMYEYGLKLESEYRHYISAVIPAGVNLAYMCTQMKAAVDSEQNKTIWVPSNNS